MMYSACCSWVQSIYFVGHCENDSSILREIQNSLKIFLKKYRKKLKLIICQNSNHYFEVNNFIDKVLRAVCLQNNGKKFPFNK